MQFLKTIWRRSVVVVIMAIACCFIGLAPVQADVAAKPDPAYLEGLQSMRNQVAKAPDQPTNLALNDVLGQLFTAPAVQVPFRQTVEKAGGKTIAYSGSIFFSQGDLFINYDKTTDDENFATINGKLYAWQNNAKQGKTMTRFPGDTLGFLMYMIDPSAIMRSIYQSYLEDPKSFTVQTTEPNQKVLMLKEALSGFQGLTIQEKPFWLKNFMFSDPADPAKGIGRLEIDAPVALESLPKVLYTLPAGVQFQPSKETLKERMVYL
ncbi:MAG: hypothetical protein HC860_08670 [Alkalinema sp. RU_4_3]|nr:hypothetical protein [Alkalinema sp. RU_4_3]